MKMTLLHILNTSVPKTNTRSVTQRTHKHQLCLRPPYGSTQHGNQPCSAGALVQAQLFRGAAAATAFDASPACNQARSRPASQCLTWWCRLLDHERPRCQHWLPASGLRSESCWRIDSSTIAVDEPKRQQCAAHALATQAVARRLVWCMQIRKISCNGHLGPFFSDP